MEYCNTNSSLDTLHIFKDVKSDSHKIKYEEIFLQKKHHRHNKSNTEQRKNREKKYKTSIFTKNLITQKVHVEKKNFKCIINLNTTVCHHPNNHEAVENHDTKSMIKRIVPQCMRQQCCHPRKHTRLFKNSKGAVDMHQQTRNKKQDIKQNIPKCRHGKRLSKKTKWNGPKLAPSNQLEMGLDDISTTSLDSYMDIPMSYKHVINPRVPESKLDTLIRRAKEREQKMVISWHKNKDTYAENSIMITPMSSSTLLSRFILPQKNHGYSPSIDGLAPSPTFERYFHFSDTVQSYDFDMTIKLEPPMPIEAYSPTHSELIEDLKLTAEIKHIKIEPTPEEI